MCVHCAVLELLAVVPIGQLVRIRTNHYFAIIKLRTNTQEHPSRIKNAICTYFVRIVSSHQLARVVKVIFNLHYLLNFLRFEFNLIATTIFVRYSDVNFFSIYISFLLFPQILNCKQTNESSKYLFIMSINQSNYIVISPLPVDVSLFFSQHVTS